MSRIEATLKQLGEQGRKALIPYVTAGDPNPEETVAILHALVRSGADIIELGVPFSDPMADGPVIQLACERALRNGCTLRKVLDMVTAFRRDDSRTPIVLMGYLNPIEAMGEEKFVTAAAEAGVDGLLTVDLPPEEADTLIPQLKAHGLDAIFLISPTTTDARIRSVSEHSSGYVYYVSFKGITGAAGLNVEEVAERVANIHRLTALPVGVGFGIRDANSAKAIGQVSDGVIVGSVIVDTIANNQSGGKALHQALEDLVRPMREALDELVS